MDISEREHVNYIIIEVRERDKHPNARTDAGMIRHALHEYITAQGLEAATMISRWDREFTYYGGAQFWNPLRVMFKNWRNGVAKFSRTR
jgi:hypothetical protein